MVNIQAWITDLKVLMWYRKLFLGAIKCKYSFKIKPHNLSNLETAGALYAQIL